MVHETGGSLKISFVESLQHIVAPVIEYLNSSNNTDIFQSEHIIVPNAGVRAWLMQQLSTQLGARNGHTDGIVANVNMGYLGTLYSFLNDASPQSDPWSIDQLTMAVLQCIHASGAYTDQIERHGGALLAARAIADRFDTYHAHRPTMIDAWEHGRAELAPELGARNDDDEWLIVRHPLEARDMWQFTLWQEVRQFIGIPSPPAQLHIALQQLATSAPVNAPNKLLIAGLQSVSIRHLQVLRALSQHFPIEMVLVHPSPALAKQHSESVLPLVPRTDGTLPVRPASVAVAPNADPLIATWLRGSLEVQEILATQGLVPQHHALHTTEAHTLLHYVQQAVRHQPQLSPQKFVSDSSVQVHRAHNLARQVEILHDALLHAFNADPTLQPHEVVVLCADMAAAAPLLQAQFDRDVVVKGDATRRIPLVVADRGLREISDGAELLSGLLALVQSRISRTDLLRLVALPDIMRNVGVTPDALDTWDRLLVRTGLSWGLNDSQRSRQGMAAPLADARSWHTAIQQTLLGACLPDANPSEELGGVVPLTDIDTATLSDISALVHIVSRISTFEASTAEPQSVVQWCDLVEQTLVDLCGPSAELLADPIEVLHRVSQSTTLALPTSNVTIGVAVSFSEFAAIVTDLVSSVPGRQPLRTGAVTATSFIPLQSVPFKVVCLLGVDDGTLPAGEAEGDDLAARQRFIGDPDPRVDTRRVLLDALLAASHTFLLLCNGKSVRNNTPVPYVTPVAELVDMFIRVSGTNEPDVFSGEYQHPRHAMGALNFTPSGVVPNNTVWSHDSSALAAAHALQSPSGSQQQKVSQFPIEPSSVVTVEQLHQVLTYPTNLFFDTIGVSRWTNADEVDEAILPTALDDSIRRQLCHELLVISANNDPTQLQQWEQSVALRGVLPIGTYAADALKLVRRLVAETQVIATNWQIDSFTSTQESVRLELSNGQVVAGSIAFLKAEGPYIGRVSFKSDFATEKVRAAIDLLCLAALGHSYEGAVVITHNTEGKKNQMTPRFVSWREPLSVAQAMHRLETIVQLVTMAAQAPAVQFGQTAGLMALSKPDTDNALTQFLSFVYSDKYTTSMESLLFGALPQFDNVFTAKSPITAFWRARSAAFIDPEHQRTGAKRTSPHGATKIESYFAS